MTIMIQAQLGRHEAEIKALKMEVKLLKNIIQAQYIQAKGQDK